MIALDAPHKNQNKFILSKEIILDSIFPSGNLGQASIINTMPIQLRVKGCPDFQNDPSVKSWLYFRVSGIPISYPVKFVIKGANHLKKFTEGIVKPYYVWKEQAQPWKTIPINFNISTYQDKGLNCQFTLIPTKNSAFFISANFPYTYEDLNNKILLKCSQKYASSAIYINNETLCHSTRGFKLHMLTITSRKNLNTSSYQSTFGSPQIFPPPTNRPYSFQCAPIIFISGRVHPSEVSSSFVIEGIINFLTNQHDPRSIILRQMFIFIIIPMLNPDGVDGGNFRSDEGQRNLNRYYSHSDMQHTPTIKATEEVIKEHSDMIWMYLDMHGHQSAKGNFMYSNYWEDMKYMTQCKLMCRILQDNFLSGEFRYQDCNFSKNNKTVKEKYDQYSKECSGRVFAGTDNNIIHSYTFEVTPYVNQMMKNSTTYYNEVAISFLESILDFFLIHPNSRLNIQKLTQYRQNLTKQIILDRRKKKKMKNQCEKDTYLNIHKTMLLQYASRFTDKQYINHLESNYNLMKYPQFRKFIQQINPNKVLKQQLKKCIKKQFENQKISKQKKKQKIKKSSKYSSVVNKYQNLEFCEVNNGQIAKRYHSSIYQEDQEKISGVSNNKNNHKQSSQRIILPLKLCQPDKDIKGNRIKTDQAKYSQKNIHYIPKGFTKEKSYIKSKYYKKQGLIKNTFLEKEYIQEDNSRIKFDIKNEHNIFQDKKFIIELINILKQKKSFLNHNYKKQLINNIDTINNSKNKIYNKNNNIDSLPDITSKYQRKNYKQRMNEKKIIKLNSKKSFNQMTRKQYVHFLTNLNENQGKNKPYNQFEMMKIKYKNKINSLPIIFQGNK